MGQKRVRDGGRCNEDGFATQPSRKVVAVPVDEGNFDQAVSHHPNVCAVPPPAAKMIPLGDNHLQHATASSDFRAAQITAAGAHPELFGPPQPPLRAIQPSESGASQFSQRETSQSDIIKELKQQVDARVEQKTVYEAMLKFKDRRIEDLEAEIRKLKSQELQLEILSKMKILDDTTKEHKKETTELLRQLEEERRSSASMKDHLSTTTATVRCSELCPGFGAWWSR